MPPRKAGPLKGLSLFVSISVSFFVSLIYTRTCVSEITRRSMGFWRGKAPTQGKSSDHGSALWREFIAWKGWKHLDSHLERAYGNTNMYLQSVGNKGLHPNPACSQPFLDGISGCRIRASFSERDCIPGTQAIIPWEGHSIPIAHPHRVPSMLVFLGIIATGSPSTCFLTWPLNSQRGRIISLVSISSDLSLAWTWPGHHIILLGQASRWLLLMEVAQAGGPAVPPRRRSLSLRLC